MPLEYWVPRLKRGMTAEGRRIAFSRRGSRRRRCSELAGLRWGRGIIRTQIVWIIVVEEILSQDKPGPDCVRGRRSFPRAIADRNFRIDRSCAGDRGTRQQATYRQYECASHRKPLLVLTTNHHRPQTGIASQLTA